ncbi:MAG: glycerophosphodiester phosphodiesterase [Promethearchaeota archaeon]
MSPEFFYIGHRGTRTNFDENTIGAFEEAVNFGAEYIEFDIHRTKDRQLIILHDSSLDRTTNGHGLVKDCSFAEIRNFKTRIKKEQIPSLSDVLERFIGRVKFMIELKGTNVREDICNFVKKKKLINECIFSCRRLDDLKEMKKRFPESKICYNITKGIGLKLVDFLKLGRRKSLPFKIDMISLRSNLITKEFIEICHKNDVFALSWDFIDYENPIEKIKSLIQLQIDGILFDNHKNIPKIKKILSKN